MQIKSKKEEKLNKMIKLANTSDEKLEKMNWKEKQAVYKAKSSLCKVAFISRNKDGKGITYKKSKKEGE